MVVRGVKWGGIRDRGSSGGAGRIIGGLGGSRVGVVYYCMT